MAGCPADRALADDALRRLEVDVLGLDAMDRRYLRRLAEHHGGGPVGVETLAAALAIYIAVLVWQAYLVYDSLNGWSETYVVEYENIVTEEAEQ